MRPPSPAAPPRARADTPAPRLAVVFITSNYIGNSEMMEVRAPAPPFRRPLRRRPVASVGRGSPACEAHTGGKLTLTLTPSSTYRDAKRPVSRASARSGTS